MTELPNWTPEVVRPILEELDQHPRTIGPRREVMDRILTDPRMRVVYDEFLRRARDDVGGFYHQSLLERASPEEGQLAAIRELLELVTSAAGDKIRVSKNEEIEAAKLRWSGDSKRLRDLAHDFKLAAELGALGFDETKSQALALQDAEAMIRVANWLDHLTSATRSPGDPLIVERDSVHPIVRGVQIMISVKLKELFGDHFHGIAATLTSVALGAETTPRVSRSAFASKKAR
jgi:hypothetical protein